MLKVLKNIIPIKTIRFQPRGKSLARLAVTHHKCATNYLNKVCIEVAALSDLQFIGVRDFFNEPGSEFSKSEAYKRLLSAGKRDKPFFFIQRGDYKKHIKASNLVDYRAFHVVRDPRDMIVSGYFSHKYSHSTEGPWHKNWLVPYRKYLNEVSEEEGLMNEIEIGHSLKMMSSWNYDDPNILELKFEDLIANSLKIYGHIFDFLQLDVNADELEKIIQKYSFKNMSKGREPGQEDVTHHFRRGIPGDWKNHFTNGHIELFKQKWGDLLIQLGYEKDKNWSNI